MSCPECGDAEAEWSSTSEKERFVQQESDCLASVVLSVRLTAPMFTYSGIGVSPKVLYIG